MKRVLGLLLLFTTATIGCASQSSTQDTPPFTFDTDADPNAWALVPEGEFLMGLHNHETPLDYDFEIMVTTVTNAQYAQYLNEALPLNSDRI